MKGLSMRRLALLLTCAALLSPFAARAEEATEDPDLPKVGSEAPLFQLPTYNAEAAGAPRAGTALLIGDDVDDKDAKLVVVSFMASFCKPCRKELPFLEKLHGQYRKQGLRVIAVSIDREPEGQKVVSDLVSEAKITFPVVKDQYNITAKRYLGSKFPLPSVFVVDHTGKIVFMSRGYNEEISKTLSAEVQKALGGGAAK